MRHPDTIKSSGRGAQSDVIFLAIWLGEPFVSRLSDEGMLIWLARLVFQKKTPAQSSGSAAWRIGETVRTPYRSSESLSRRSFRRSNERRLRRRALLVIGTTPKCLLSRGLPVPIPPVLWQDAPGYARAKRQIADPI